MYSSRAPTGLQQTESEDWKLNLLGVLKWFLALSQSNRIPPHGWYFFNAVVTWFMHFWFVDFFQLSAIGVKFNSTKMCFFSTKVLLSS